MDMQQKIELLLAGQKEMVARLEDKMDAKIDSYQKKAGASMVEDTMERQMKNLMMVKWHTHQETTEIYPDTEIM
jgi:hypothetical protein